MALNAARAQESVTGAEGISAPMLRAARAHLVDNKRLEASSQNVVRCASRDHNVVSYGCGFYVASTNKAFCVFQPGFCAHPHRDVERTEVLKGQ